MQTREVGGGSHSWEEEQRLRSALPGEAALWRRIQALDEIARALRSRAEFPSNLAEDRDE